MWSRFANASRTTSGINTPSAMSRIMWRSLASIARFESLQAGLTANLRRARGRATLPERLRLGESTAPRSEDDRQEGRHRIHAPVGPVGAGRGSRLLAR